jgi:hypothetical protein
MKIRFSLVALAALTLPFASHAEASSRQVVDVTGWIEGAGPTTDVLGRASLVRTADGLSMTFRSTGLPAGSAVTIWWIIFEGGNLRSAQFAAGHVVGGRGVANFAGHLAEGDTSGCFLPDELFPCKGLSNATNAMVILLARVHGPADPGRIPVQIHTAETTGVNIPIDLCHSQDPPVLCQVAAAIFPAS